MEFDATEWSTDDEDHNPPPRVTSNSSEGVPNHDSGGLGRQHASHSSSPPTLSDTNSPVVEPEVDDVPEIGLPGSESDVDDGRILLDPNAAEFIPMYVDEHPDTGMPELESDDDDPNPDSTMSPLAGDADDGNILLDPTTAEFISAGSGLENANMGTTQPDPSLLFDESTSSQDITFLGFSSDEDVAPNDDTVVECEPVVEADDGPSLSSEVDDTLVIPPDDDESDNFEPGSESVDEVLNEENKSSTSSASTACNDTERDSNSSDEFLTDVGGSHTSDYTTADESPPPVRPLISFSSKPSSSGRSSRNSQSGVSRRSTRRRKAKEFLTYNRDFKQTVGTHGPGFILSMQVEDQ